jgi:hypothetical protein
LKDVTSTHDHAFAGEDEDEDGGEPVDDDGYDCGEDNESWSFAFEFEVL